MFCISMLVSSSEWVRIRDAAARQFPNENLSRAEICRRYVLAGVDAIKNASPADCARLAHQFQASVESGDQRLKLR